MKNSKSLVIFCTAIWFLGCTVTEKIIFTEKGSGEFLVDYDLGNVMKTIGSTFKPEDSLNSDAVGSKKLIDTTIVIKDMLALMKDSMSTLSQEKKLSLEAMQDMYITMKMDEANDFYNFQIGMDFDSISELKGIQNKVKEAQGFTGHGNTFSNLPSESPFSNLLGNENGDVIYNYSDFSFTRKTNLPENYNVLDSLFHTLPEEGEFNDMLEDAFYKVELTFPQKIKNSDRLQYKLSEDSKTLMYKVGWLEFLRDPRMLDVKVEFEDE